MGEGLVADMADAYFVGLVCGSELGGGKGLKGVGLYSAVGFGFGLVTLVFGESLIRFVRVRANLIISRISGVEI